MISHSRTKCHKTTIERLTTVCSVGWNNKYLLSSPVMVLWLCDISYSIYDRFMGSTALQKLNAPHSAQITFQTILRFQSSLTKAAGPSGSSHYGELHTVGCLSSVIWKYGEADPTRIMSRVCRSWTGSLLDGKLKAHMWPIPAAILFFFCKT